MSLQLISKKFALGKRAASMMFGGIAGVATQELVILLYHTGYYARKYKPKK